MKRGSDLRHGLRAGQVVGATAKKRIIFQLARVLLNKINPHEVDSLSSKGYSQAWKPVAQNNFDLRSATGDRSGNKKNLPDAACLSMK